jgi:predicted nucleotidyltransferase
MPKMGKELTAKAGLASALFSRVRLRVLSILIGNPGHKFHTAEIIAIARSGFGAVQRELRKLADVGILNTETVGNRKFYQANRQSPIFKELHGLIIKTVGLIEPIRNALKPYSSKINVAFVYGSVATGRDTAKSDIDLLIIGEGLSYSDVYAALQKIEKRLLRPINPNLMTKSEWQQRIADQTPFVRAILRRPKLFIFGTEHELEGIR